MEEGWYPGSSVGWQVRSPTPELMEEDTTPEVLLDEDTATPVRAHKPSPTTPATGKAFATDYVVEDL